MKKINLNKLLQRELIFNKLFMICVHRDIAQITNKENTFWGVSKREHIDNLSKAIDEEKVKYNSFLI